MDLSEQALLQEVLYLHSLWHQGPPRNPNPNPNPGIAHSLNHSQQHQGLPYNPNPRQRHNLLYTPRLPGPAAHFDCFARSNPNSKKIKKKRKKKVISDIPWPCEEAVPGTSAGPSGWLPFKPNTASAVRNPSAEQLAKRAAALAQQEGLKACQVFFGSNAGSDDDDEEDCGEDEGSEDVDMEGNGGFEGSDELKFFLKAFRDDDELRGYYEKSYESGEFCCLVCGGTKEKVGKKYRDCVALVQHTVSISKTKKKRAHRAYGHVICKVLGWDINRLPSIPSSTGEPLSHASVKSSEPQGNGESVNSGNVEAIETECPDACGQEGSAKKDDGISSNGDSVELMDCNIVSEQCDAVGSLGNTGEGVPEITIGSALVNGLKSCSI